MPKEDFKTVPLPFLCRGVQLAKPIDQLAPGEYSYLQNVRSYQLGTLQARNGSDLIAAAITGQTIAHSIRRLNDPLNGTFTRVVGAGTHLGAGSGFPTTDLGGGWSGNPLALAPWRPTESPLAWMYVADSNKMAKVNSSNTLHSVGIPWVSTPPQIRIADSGPPGSVETGSTDFEYANTQSTASWTNTGTAGAITLLSGGVGLRVNTTISTIIFDNGVSGPGVASIVPASMAGIGQDATIKFSSTSEVQRILEVLPAIETTTIAAIIYDSGSTGACSIALTASSLPVRKNCIVQIGTGMTQETVQVTDVALSNIGQYSIRVTLANTHAAAEAVVGLASFRVATTNNYTAGAAMTLDGLTSSITSGIGGFKLAIAEDIVTIANIGTLQQDDYIHISVRVSALSQLIEGKVMFDVDATTNTFTQNYYYYPFRPNDLVPSVAGTQTLVQAKTTAVTNTQVDTSGINQPAQVLRPLTALPVSPGYRTPPTQLYQPAGDIGGNDVNLGAPNQTQLGNNQFLELTFRFSDLIRVGTDLSRDLRNVEAVQIQFNVSATTQVDITSAWVGGFFGPDVGNLGQPYQYRVQYRASSTGARSAFNPPNRAGVVPRRNPVQVSYAFSTTAECDKADIYRFGGTLLQWTYVGTGTNNPAGGTGTFIDVQSDTALDASQLGNPDWYQPWPIEDQPKLGTTGTVAGSSLKDSGTNFNVLWAQGTLILINGFAATIYRVISTSLLETYENLGSQSAVSWEVPNPIINAQPLPCLWGPFENFFFACGDPKNAGRLYFSRGNDPDSTQEEYWIDVTSPSEPLMNGCMYNGTCFVYSSERAFRIYPTFGQFNLIDPTIPGSGLFRAIEVPNGKGLFMRWGLAVGPKMWTIGKDGIYEGDGGAPVNITNDDLFPIFPHEGSVGVTTNNYNAPNLVAAEAPYHRLAYYDSQLYYDFIDTTNVRSSWVRKMPAPTDKQGIPSGWFFDSYSPGVITHYGEEGQNIHELLIGMADGNVYQQDSTTLQDGSFVMGCIVQTGATDLGDTRLKKIFGDWNLDINTNGLAVVTQASFDNFTRATVTTNVTTASRLANPPIIDVGGGTGARNMGVNLTWTQQTLGATGPVTCYSWTPTAIPKPENIELRASDWDDAGYQGNKFVQGVILEADTFNVTKTLEIEIDGNVVAFTFSATHNGQEQLPYSWPPFLAHMMRIQAVDNNPWELYGFRWVFNPAPESVQYWETQTRPINGHGYGHLRDGYITLVSTAPVTVNVITDGVSYPCFDGDTGASTIPSTGGIQLKKYVIFQPVKGKIVRYNLTSTAPFQVFQDSSEIRVRSWGDTGPYESLRPFGDLSNLTGARI